jgi:hypothetical protein
MGAQVKHLSLRMLETQAQRSRIGFKPVDYYQQAWTTKEHPGDEYEVKTDGLRAYITYHPSGWRIQELDIDNTYEFADKNHVVRGIRRTD